MSTALATPPRTAVPALPGIRLVAAGAAIVSVAALAAFWILIGAPALALGQAGHAAGPHDPVAGLFWYGP